MIVVGVVNNMQDAALRTTERQFRELLAAAAGERAVRVRFFSIPELPRERAGRAYVETHYADVSAIATAGLDGLIVTGTDPQGHVLVEEPYYKPLTQLVDWADEHLASTVWSCLAAHATVQHLDGISRERFPQKLAGVYGVSPVADHPILAGMPAQWRMPHSRHNTVTADALNAAGYQLLSKSDDAGPDMFVRQAKSLFLFVQGHPEYDPGALLREYRRDVGRYLSGVREAYPPMPSNYFDEAAVAAANEFRKLALRTRDPALLDRFPFNGSGDGMAHPWSDSAVRLYSNWLSYLEDRRAQRAVQRQSTGAAAQ
jgi:homoserine O-succinyltransferase